MSQDIFAAPENEENINQEGIEAKTYEGIGRLAYLGYSILTGFGL